MLKKSFTMELRRKMQKLLQNARPICEGYGRSQGNKR